MSATAGHAAHHPGFVRRYLFSTDHKTIGRQFLFLALVFFVVGGVLAMGIRWQLAWPWTEIPVLGRLLWPASGNILPPEFYNVLFTMHGTIMIFFVIIPILVGAFGNFVIPLHIGARDMAFPVLNLLSFWTAVPAGLILVTGFFLEGGAAAAGWTSYAPLSALPAAAPGSGIGQTCWIISLIMLGISSMMGAVNYLTTIINMRAPGLSFHRLSLTVWSLFITSILVLLATPVLTSAVAMLLLDRVAGTTFFLPAGLVVSGEPVGNSGGGQPLLWQHLFWFYSHPAVYIMILPAMGVVSDVLAVFARRPIFGYLAMAYAMVAIAGLGFIVWGHHMFQSGMNPVLGTTFMLSTMLIAVPSSIKTFNWLGTLWGGSIRFTTAMLNALAFVSMFVIGGLSGVFLGSTAVDMFLHDTYFVVAHLHYVLFGGSLFGFFAGLYYWYPKMFGRLMSERWGKIHFVLSFLAFNVTFFPMHLLGLHGMPRRIADFTQYEFLRPLQPMNQVMTVSAFVLGAAQVVFLLNFFLSLARGRRAGENPWRANTLEWTTPSPPPHGNFATIPVVYRGPYEYSSPEVAEDWLPQTRALTGRGSPA